MLTRTSRRPNAAAAPSTRVRHSSGLERSARQTYERRPVASIALAAASASTAERLYDSATSQPACARACATAAPMRFPPVMSRSEEHTSELQSRFGISYAVFCLKKKKQL